MDAHFRVSRLGSLGSAGYRPWPSICGHWSFESLGLTVEFEGRGSMGCRAHRKRALLLAGSRRGPLGPGTHGISTGQRVAVCWTGSAGLVQRNAEQHNLGRYWTSDSVSSPAMTVLDMARTAKTKTRNHVSGALWTATAGFVFDFAPVSRPGTTRSTGVAS
eukprot:2553246-Rhodomonas_salina.1